MERSATCNQGYLLIANNRVLLKIAKSALEEYEKLMKDDYQKKFDYYAEYILDFAPDMVESFMTTNASNYFTCVEKVFRVCCSDCTSAAGELISRTGCPTFLFELYSPDFDHRLQGLWRSRKQLWKD